MTQYLLLNLEDENAHATQAPKAMANLIDQRAVYAEKLRQAGRLLDASRLRPSREGRRLHRRGEQLEIGEGPFAEEGQALCGYYWVEANTVADAAQIAEQCPGLPTDAIDVRPLLKGSVPIEKESKPGKIFACAVLGNAATQADWVAVMDRIDAETRDGFPVDHILGGVRLQPPESGKRVVTRGERRATFDGPFLESKEVIGGLFMLRMNTLDDAVRWASSTRFLVHGGLEIRELWRI